jgi:hypothetical protein
LLFPPSNIPVAPIAENKIPFKQLEKLPDSINSLIPDITLSNEVSDINTLDNVESWRPRIDANEGAISSNFENTQNYNERITDIVNKINDSNDPLNPYGNSLDVDIANDIKKTLKRIQESKGSGFLFLGFGITSKKPKIYETFWGKNILNDVFFEGKEREDLILSGDAKKYVDKYLDDTQEKEYRKNHILNGTIKDAQKYCDRLYKIAEEAQTKAGEDIFGGHRHQLVIK